MPTGDKISALPAASDLTGAELFPVVQGGVTKQATINQIGTAWGRSFADNAPAIQAGDGATEFDYATITIPAGTVKTNSSITIRVAAYRDNANTFNVSGYAYIGTNRLASASTTGTEFGAVSESILSILSLASAINTADIAGSLATQPVAIDFTADVDVDFKVYAETGDNVGLWHYSVEVTGGA